MTPSTVKEFYDPWQQLAALLCELKPLANELEHALSEQAHVVELGQNADAAAAFVRRIFGSTIAPECVYDLLAALPEQRQIELAHRHPGLVRSKIQDLCGQIRQPLSRLAVDDHKAEKA